MAELVNIAGDGLPSYLWAKFARAGQSGWDVGLERARGGLGGFAFQNTVVREVGGEVGACLLGYPLRDSPPAPAGDVPAPLGPLIELGRLAPPERWYLNVLATLPQHRGKGLASDLLRIADEFAREAESVRPCISLIVSDANAGARRLYARHGYRQLSSRPIVKEAWEHAGENWLLLLKEMSA